MVSAAKVSSEPETPKIDIESDGRSDGQRDSSLQLVKTKRSSSWWAKRTFLERLLLLIAVVLLLITIAVIIIAATRSATAAGRDGNKDTPKVCMSPSCIQTAAQLGDKIDKLSEDLRRFLVLDDLSASSRILEAMQPSVSPCEDFFTYACGSWNKKNVIPDDMAVYTTFSKLRDDLQVVFKGLLEMPISDSEPESIQNAKRMYQSCLNMKLIEDRGDEPLKQFLRQISGWPVLDATWDEDTYDWVDHMAKLRLYNNRILINQWVSSDDRDSKVNVIQLDQTQLGMPSRDYFLKGRTDSLNAYKTYAADIAKLLGANEATADREMAEMVEFEIKIANLTTPDDQRRDTEALYNKMTIADLYTNISQDFAWHRYLNTIFANVSETLTRDHVIIVYAPDYLREMIDLVGKTSKRTVANYMTWRIVMNRVSNMPQKYLDLRRKYNKVLFGTATDRARWRMCVTYAHDNFGMAVGRMFVQQHFKEEAKISALDMIQNIRSAFNELLEEVPWMDEPTRAVAREKADAIQEKIGYPDYILNDTALNMDYTGLVINETQYIENVLRILNFAARENLKNLRLPVDRSRWSTTPGVVNAFYSATKNQIMFPAAIFQPPFYQGSYPNFLNYGGLGMVIGHEITHGYDDRGRQFDKDGNLAQWWSPEVVELFKEKAQCIIDQYGNYTVPEVGLNLNGLNTQGENIADNGGLKQAFRAYRHWVERRGREEDLLPGVDLTHNQLFFLNFAQIWCGTSRPESYIQAISSGRHSPGRFRVIGALSNSHDFAKAYSCPLGSTMNPVKKCAVW